MGFIEVESIQRNIAKHRVRAMCGAEEEVNEKIKGYNPSSFLNGLDYGFDLAEKLIHNQPTVDAVPVVRGEWIDTQPEYHSGFYNNTHKCSVCQDYYTTDYNYMNFCPNCGARMVKDNE